MDGANFTKLYYYHISETEPKEALRGLKYAGELREKRLQKFGLTRKLKYASGTGTLNGMKISRCEDERYVSEMYAHDGILTETIQSGEKKLYAESEDRICYATVTDTKGGRLYGEEVYCCPNCGAPAKIKELEEGCRFCGTHFEMAELFPKISSAFSVKNLSEAGKKHSSARPFVITGLIIGIIVGIFSLMHNGVSFEAIFGSAMAALLCAFLGYVVWAIKKFGAVVKEGARSAPMLGAIGSNKKFEKIMSRYSPEYTYEFFTGIVTSMVQVMIFSDRDEQLPFYMGKENSLFEDVVSSTFRGALKLEDCSIAGDVANARVKVFLENLHYDGKKIHKKDETVQVSLKKDLKGRVNNPFAVHAINCRSCGGVFDAYKHRSCPFCGREYELQDVDWIITDFSM